MYSTDSHAQVHSVLSPPISSPSLLYTDTQTYRPSAPSSRSKVGYQVLPKVLCLLTYTSFPLPTPHSFPTYMAHIGIPHSHHSPHPLLLLIPNMYPLTRKPLFSTFGLPIPAWLVLKIQRLAFYKIHECLLPSAFCLLSSSSYYTTTALPHVSLSSLFTIALPLTPLSRWVSLAVGSRKSFRIALRFYLP